VVYGTGYKSANLTAVALHSSRVLQVVTHPFFFMFILINITPSLGTISIKELRGCRKYNPGHVVHTLEGVGNSNGINILISGSSTSQIGCPSGWVV
jgi:hypothetical protein